MAQWLESDLLKHIVHLEVLQAHPEDVQHVWLKTPEGRAFLLWLPSTASSYDREHYGDCDHVVFLASDSPFASRALLPYIPKGKLVFKLTNPWDFPVLSQRFSLGRITSFLSYTSSRHTQLKPVDNILVNETLDPKCLELYRAQGYDTTEISSLFRSDQAISFTRYHSGEPITTCYAFCNYKSVWEIAGVYTIPEERYKGHGKDIVVAAMRTLLRRGFLPRFQAAEENIPSVALAETLGLEHFLTATHYRAESW